MPISVNLSLEPLKNLAFIRGQIPLASPESKGDFEKILVPPLLSGG